MVFYLAPYVVIVIVFLSGCKGRAFFALTLLAVVSALRFDVGYDFLSYYTAIAEYAGDAETYRRFGYLHGLIIKASHYTGYFQFYFVVTSLFFYLIFYMVLKRDGRDIVVSVAVFLSIPFFFLMSFNFIRQFSAIIMVYLGFSFIYQRKLLLFFLVVFLASLVHYTALVVLPLYGIYKRRFGIGFYITVLISSLFLFPVAKLAIDVLLPRYSHYLATASAGGAIFQIFLMALSLLLLMFKQYRGDTIKVFYFNVFVIGVVFYNMFQPIGFAGTRISYYFLFSLVFLASMLFENVRKQQFRFVVLVCSFILMAISLILHSKVGTRSPSIPYQTYFNKTVDDIRPYDWVKQ